MAMKSPHQLIAHAARLLDLRGDVPGAVNALREALALAQQQQDRISQIQASAFLGELLIASGDHEEAIGLFRGVVALAEDKAVEPDLVEHEVRVSRQHLAELSSPGKGPRP